MIGEMVIEARGLTKRFGKVVALDDVDLNVPGGSAFGLLGPAGSGKSTVIRLLAGLARPTAGTLTIGGSAAGSLAARRQLGVLPEDTQLYGWMTAREALAFAAVLAGVGDPEVAARIEDVAERFSIADMLGRRIAALPAPLRGRLAIAQTLIGDPAIVLLDEPFRTFDADDRDQVLSVLGELRGSRTIVLAAYRLEDIEALCDRMAILEVGRVVGTVAVARAPGTRPEAPVRREPIGTGLAAVSVPVLVREALRRVVGR